MPSTTMVPSLSLERVLGELCESAETSSAVSLAPITQALGGSYSLLFRTERDGAVLEASCYGVDVGYLERLKEASQLHLLPPWLTGLEAGSVVDRTAFGSDLQFGRTAFCHHVVRPEGAFHCVIATPLASGPDRFHLVVGRPRTQCEFDGDSRRLLRFMLPQVAEILQLRADLAATRQHLGHAERALDGLPEPVLVVGHDATVVSANRAARRLVAAHDVIWPDARARLTAATPLETGKLRKAIQAAAEGNGTTFLLVPGRDHQGPLRLTLSQLRESDCRCSDRAKVLIVADPVDLVDDEQRILGTARTYGLTRREVDVVRQLTRGRTLKVAARDLGMSYNTARSYVRQVFGKTAVHRQSDLLRLFTTGHRPQAPHA